MNHSPSPAPPIASHEQAPSMSMFANSADYWRAMYEYREKEAHLLSEEIIRLRRAAAPAEPVAWQWRRKGNPWTLEKTFNSQVFATTEDSEVRALFAQGIEQPALAQPEVLQQALDAMEIKQRVSLWENDTDAQAFRAAIAALRALLEAVQPAIEEPGAAGMALAIKEHREKQARAAGVHPSPAPQEGEAMNFGHNPDPAIDFACEVDCIEAEIIDRAAGMAPTMNDLGARIERAMQFKAGGSTNAIAAKHDLRKIEAAFKAGAAAPAPQAQPDEAGVKEGGNV